MNEDEILKKYRQQREHERLRRLEVHTKEVTNIKRACDRHGVHLKDDDFDFSDPVGVTANSKNILSILVPELQKDKDDLVKCKLLNELFHKKNNIAGYYYSDDFMVMLTPLLRRGMHKSNNWAPRFVEIFWKLNLNGIEASIALDNDRVRIDATDFGYVELDTWFGAPFQRQIEEIPDGIVKLRPPLDVEERFISTFFHEKYSLDVKWDTKKNIKTFQALEFSNANIVVEWDGSTYHPAKYIHAEYDVTAKSFRHFDGAVHFYDSNEYLSRRNSDFNHASKSKKQVKARSQKVFKLDGDIKVNMWIELCSHFFSGNPLIIEYFTGKYPQYVIDGLKRVRT